MPQKIPVLDLLSKLSGSSFLIDTRNESIVITPGVFFGLPGKFFEYIDVVDTALKVMKTDEKGAGVVDMEEFKDAIAPKALDLNQYFVSLEKEIPNKDVLGLNETQQPQTETAKQDAKEANTQTTKQKTVKTRPQKAYNKYSGKRTYSGKGKSSANVKGGYKTYSKKSGAK